MSRAGRMV
jgi:hypothetical protein